MTKPLLYPGGVRVYNGSRGHRVAWTTRDGQRRSAQRAELDDACALAAQVSRELADVEAAGDDASLATVADEYIKVHSVADDWSQSYRENERRNLDRWLLPGLGGPARLLTRSAVADVALAVRDGIRSEAYAAQVLGTLRRVWAYAVRAGYIPAERKDWASMSTKARRTQGHSREFVDAAARPTTEKVRLLARRAAWDQPMLAAIYLGAFCGLRWGEMVALEWGDIDFNEGVVKVRRQWVDGEIKLPKRGKVRETVLPDPVAEKMRQWARRGDLVAPAPNNNYWTPQQFSREFTKVRDAAGWDQGWTFHSLRHHFATWLLGKGVPVEDVAMLMGHSSPDVTWRTYVGVAEGALGRAREATRTL